MTRLAGRLIPAASVEVAVKVSRAPDRNPASTHDRSSGRTKHQAGKASGPTLNAESGITAKKYSFPVS